MDQAFRSAAEPKEEAEEEAEAGQASLRSKVEGKLEAARLEEQLEKGQRNYPCN
jgi:hypothetical protein